MATFSSFFFFFFFSFILLLAGHTISADQFTCKSTSCENGGLSIQFPFWLKSLSILNQSHHNCGYPGFELSCSNTTTTSHSFSQPLLTLPESGDYAVKLISLEDQKVWINDPNECLPERIIRNHGLNLQGSPFQLSDHYTLVNYSFLNCPSNLTSPYMIQPITCLNLTSSDYNNINYSVLAVLSDPLFPTPWISSCHLISSALIPVEDMPWMFWTDYYSDIVLQWVNPNCGSCEARGGRCGFLRDTTFDVYCYDLPGQTQGVSRKAKYGITLGLGIPGLLGIIWLTCFFCRKLNPRDQQQQRRSIEFSSMILPRTPAVVMGLDGARIERYPKTQLGESGRLPKPNDNICSICLCEYQPKEMLRTIPECNHYFHANCIDEWLKMNATCPLCRNLPERSFLISPSLPPSPTS